MRERTRRTVSLAEVESAAAELCESLARLAALHGQWHTLLEERREALRRADVEAMTSCAKREAAAVEAIQREDDLRRHAMASLAAALGRSREGELTVAALAANVPGPRGVELLEGARRLRAAAERTRSGGQTLRDAAQRLSAHVQSWLGRWQAMTAPVSVYGPAGRVGQNFSASSAVDVRR